MFRASVRVARGRAAWANFVGGYRHRSQQTFEKEDPRRALHKGGSVSKTITFFRAPHLTPFGTKARATPGDVQTPPHCIENRGGFWWSRTSRTPLVRTLQAEPLKAFKRAYVYVLFPDAPSVAAESRRANQSKHAGGMRERREAGGCVPLGCVLSAFCDLGAGDGLGWGQRATVKLTAVAFRGQRGRFLAASRAGRRAAWEASKNEVKHHGKHAPFSPSFLVVILHRPGRLPTAIARKGRAQLGKRARQGREGTRPGAAAVSTAKR